MRNTAKIIESLQNDILRLQGHKRTGGNLLDMGLHFLKESFPNGSFPLGAVHEFLSLNPEDKAATCGFINSLLSPLMGNNGTLLWIGYAQTLFPPALRCFGVQPDRCIFVVVRNEKDMLWVMEEALKCSALRAVVGEMREISFTTSRRLQLAVEESQVTGFILRSSSRIPNTNACASRWKITSQTSESIEDLPGIGFPTWRLELLRVRNGKPGIWDVRWINGEYLPVYHADSQATKWQKKAG